MQAGSGRSAITVREPVLSRTESGRWRVGADIGGTELHLAADEPLAANGDAWTAAMLLPAARARATLRIESDLDRRMHRNLAEIQKIARSCWNFGGAQLVPQRLVERARGGRKAMFFTCGVDSFHALWNRRDAVDQLVYVHGFDIRLDDVERFAATRSWVKQVAEEVGVRAVFPRTNLRQHPIFDSVSWEVAHTAALAMVAHAMAPGVSRAYIASSEMPPPWGNIDPLWSSDGIEIVSESPGMSRLDKVRAIAEWPLVHRFLRVCWENRSSALNCGVCSKCVRTQTLFAIVGTRHRLQTFPQTPLIELIDGLGWQSPDRQDFWVSLLERVGEPRLEAAIRRLLARRESAVERLQRQGLWLKRSAPGRLLRSVAKRLLVARPRPGRPAREPALGDGARTTRKPVLQQS